MLSTTGHVVGQWCDASKLRGSRNRFNVPYEVSQMMTGGSVLWSKKKIQVTGLQVVVNLGNQSLGKLYSPAVVLKTRNFM